jgi:hypothetical protein
MASCTQVAGFLRQVNDRNVTAPLPGADVSALEHLGLVRQMSPDQMRQVQADVQRLQQTHAALVQEAAQRGQVAGALAGDTRRSHSILFHLEGVDRQHATLERLQQEQAALKSLDDDYARRQQDFAQLLTQQALLDTSCAFDGGYVAITPAGRVALRDLDVRLYRVGDEEFGAYWTESQKVDQELVAIASQGAALVAPLVGALPGVDRSYLWAVAIGMAKSAATPSDQLTRFVAAYRAISAMSPNIENRLMAAEVVTVTPHTVEEAVAALGQLKPQARRFGVPDDAALGVAAILLLGQRADGTFATDPLKMFLRVTHSYEAAGLLAIVNVPFEALRAKFDNLRGLFGSWGYAGTEDAELSSAYLAISDLPADSVAPKMAILTRGLAGYLQYPLVASAILASIPVLEANETLNLMEKAYEILGQRTGPMTQAELICLAVRAIHGIQVATVNELDPTAKATPSAAPGFSYVGRPPVFWAPVFIANGLYYSTFSGIGGAHPGHVHTWGGGGWGGGGFVG